MEIICKNCNTSHFLSDDKIPLETKTGKCKQCSAPITVLGKNAIVSIEPTPIQSILPEPEATKKCDFCGEKILAIAKKCRHCGSMLDGSHAANFQAGVKPPEDVTSPSTDKFVDNTLVHKIGNNKKISGDNTATRQWRKKTKIIVVVFLLTVSLVLTWYVKVYEVVTTTIEYRNNFAYIPNSSEPFTGKYVALPYDNGQKKEEENFKDGKQDGLEARWFKNGQKESEENYKNGKRDGLHTWWHENGQKRWETNYKDGEEDGLSTGWDENGQKRWETNYKDGEKDGLEKTWHKNGQKKSETNYKNGKQDGLDTSWYENGQKESETNYKDGKKDGLHTWWHENGQKSWETNYKDGEEDGLEKTWHKNGQKKSETNYKNGKQDGLDTSWYENGQKESETNYKDGKKDGLDASWDENGQKAWETNFKNGKLDGLDTWWYDDKRKIFERNYKDGKPVTNEQKSNNAPIWKNALKELFGMTNASGKIKTANNKLSSIWFEQSFQNKNDNARVIFIKTQTLENNGEIDACHACSAEIGAVTYKKVNDGWQVISKQLQIGDVGSLGDAPAITQAEILQISPNTFAFLISDGDSGQGYDTTGKYIILFKNDKWQHLGFVQTGESNGATSQCGEEHKCFSSEGKISVIAGEKEYPDLLVTKTGTEQDDKDNIIPAKNTIYVFNGKEYKSKNELLEKQVVKQAEPNTPVAQINQQEVKSYKKWTGNLENGIVSIIITEPCQISEFTNQGYTYSISSSIPIFRLKQQTDAWQVSGDRAITVMGCWSKKEGELIHAKLKRKKDSKTWEQDFKLDDGNWVGE